MGRDTRHAAVVLLSGGLDSVTVLARAATAGRAVFALSFDYGQRHVAELACARRQARRWGAVAHEVVDLSSLSRLVRSSTALVAASALQVPKDRALDGDTEIPSTYVPARNTLFLSYGLAWAESLCAGSIWLGVNALDYSGYPDCRPEFIEAYANVARLATRVGIEGNPVAIETPLIDLHKHEIVTLGAGLGVDYADTVSCYDPIGGEDEAPSACGRCDSCRLRRDGFARAGVADPTRYAPEGP